MKTGKMVHKREGLVWWGERTREPFVAKPAREYAPPTVRSMVRKCNLKDVMPCNKAAGKARRSVRADGRQRGDGAQGTDAPYHTDLALPALRNEPKLGGGL